jgi:hypothetical protein
MMLKILTVLGVGKILTYTISLFKLFLKNYHCEHKDCSHILQLRACHVSNISNGCLMSYVPLLLLVVVAMIC